MYQKEVKTETCLLQSAISLTGLVVPYQIVSRKGDTYQIAQETVVPIGKDPKQIDNQTFADAVQLVADFWSRGYVQGDYAPENLAYHGGRLKALDLDSFERVDGSEFESLEEVLRGMHRYYGRKACA